MDYGCVYHIASQKVISIGANKGSDDDGDVMKFLISPTFVEDPITWQCE